MEFSERFDSYFRHVPGSASLMLDTLMIVHQKLEGKKVQDQIFGMIYLGVSHKLVIDVDWLFDQLFNLTKVCEATYGHLFKKKSDTSEMWNFLFDFTKEKEPREGTPLTKKRAPSHESWKFLRDKIVRSREKIKPFRDKACAHLDLDVKEPPKLSFSLLKEAFDEWAMIYRNLYFIATGGSMLIFPKDLPWSFPEKSADHLVEGITRDREILRNEQLKK